MRKLRLILSGILCLYPIVPRALAAERLPATDDARPERSSAAAVREHLDVRRSLFFTPPGEGGETLSLDAATAGDALQTGGDAGSAALGSCAMPVSPEADCPTLVGGRILKVCPSGCAFTSIQAAINVALPNDTVEVLPSLNPYVGSLVVNRTGINLVADHSLDRYFEVRVQTAATGIGVSIGADRVCMKGFRIDHRATDSAVLVLGGSAARRQNVRLIGNTVDLTGSTGAARGIELKGTDQVSVVNNLVVGRGDSVGVLLESNLGNINDSIWGNRISGCSSGILLGASSFFFVNPLPISNNTIAFNHITRFDQGIQAFVMDVFPGQLVPVQDNLYYGNVISDGLGSGSIGMFLMGTQREQVCAAEIHGVFAGVALEDSTANATSVKTQVRDSHIDASHWAIAVGPSTGNEFTGNSLSTPKSGAVDPASYNACIAFVQNTGANVISTGEAFSSDTWIFEDLRGVSGAPFIDTPDDPRLVDLLELVVIR